MSRMITAVAAVLALKMTTPSSWPSGKTRAPQFFAEHTYDSNRIAQQPRVHMIDPSTDSMDRSGGFSLHLGHEGGALMTKVSPRCSSSHTRLLVRTEAGQLYSEMGSLDRAPSSPTCSLRTPRVLPICPLCAPLLRRACTHERPAALSQNAHDVTLRVHRTGTTTLASPKPEITTATALCPVRNTSKGPSASQSSPATDADPPGSDEENAAPESCA